MSDPFSKLPAGAHPFYVTDSFTILLTPDATLPNGSHIKYFQPGPANQSGSIGAGKQVRVYVKSFHMVSLPLKPDSADGVNTDAFLGLYEVSGPCAVWQNRMPFAAPYGTADNGMILNQVSKISNNTPRAWREFGLDMPLVMGQMSGLGSYQIGAGFQFNFGVPEVEIQYEYCLHGYWIAT